ncbi:MAG: hypothetical protein IPL77_14195 [Flavobacteriales bacterium]|nr:hypothetical protein [Flavobacteriales bacterium]
MDAISLQGVTDAGCVIDGDGTDVLMPALTPSTNYLLYVYNPGDAGGFEGTFDLMVERPGMDDAGITSVNYPVGLVCTSLSGTQSDALRNFGETTLTSVTMRPTMRMV